jgi:LDH2 family malate/lactate/ureidoglycolate dehydrogenase
MGDSESSITVAIASARSVAEGILTAVGAPQADAERVVDSLIYADRRGVGTHGLMRLKFYVDRVRAGGIDPRTPIQIIRDAPASALVDGGNGFGAVVTARAMELAIEKASVAGAAVVITRRMNHFGAAAYYAAMASAQGMVGVAMTNVTASMSATGGTTPVVGNNPIAFAIPSAEDNPVVFDAATSRSSWGALLLAAQRGEPLMPDAFLGPDGLPSADPETVLAGGSLQPIEGYKGYGLALCIGLLTGVLAGGAFDSEIEHPYRNLSCEGDNSALVLALDVSHFVDQREFETRIGDLAATIRSGPTAQGVDAIMMPGDREASRAQTQTSEMILERQTVTEIDELAAELQVGGLHSASQV